MVFFGPITLAIFEKTITNVLFEFENDKAHSWLAFQTEEGFHFQPILMKKPAVHKNQSK